MIEKDKQLKSIADLRLNYIGLTLNLEEIDLINIAKSNSVQELNNVLKEIVNIRVSIPNTPLSKENFENIREQCFNLYKESLINTNDYLINPDLRFKKKIEYVKKYSGMNEDQISKLDSIIVESNNDYNEMKSRIKIELGDDIAHKIYYIMSNYMSIEKDGVKKTSLEGYRNLYEELQKYNSITIDEEVKYSNVYLDDGTFNFFKLRKALKFARENNKQVNLNSLISYTSCPERLFRLEKNETNRNIVKKELFRYINEVTSVIQKENNLNDGKIVVRSIDLFNELLNRFTINNVVPYAYRGNIIQNEDKDFDNINAGWFKFLDINDLCDVVLTIKNKLPNVAFRINETNLEDPIKQEAFYKLMVKIREYEIEHKTRIIDTIGTEMHINSNTKKEQVENMFKKLNQFNMPIEVTEFDMYMTDDILNTKNKDEIELIKHNKLVEILEVVNNNKNIVGFTIWSLNDDHNFVKSKKNRKLVEEGLDTVETIYGGYYNSLMKEREVSIKMEDTSIIKNANDDFDLLIDVPKKKETLNNSILENKDGYITEQIKTLKLIKVDEKPNHIINKDLDNKKSGFAMINILYYSIGIFLIMAFVYYYVFYLGK